MSKIKSPNYVNLNTSICDSKIMTDLYFLCLKTMDMIKFLDIRQKVNDHDILHVNLLCFLCNYGKHTKS